jgi:hypothetical protein
LPYKVAGGGCWRHPNDRCSDFVVLDLEEKRVIIAEVTTAENLGNFVLKAVELHEQGTEKVRKQLVAGFKAYPNNDRRQSVVASLLDGDDLHGRILLNDRIDCKLDRLRCLAGSSYCEREAQHCRNPFHVRASICFDAPIIFYVYGTRRFL